MKMFALRGLATLYLLACASCSSGATRVNMVGPISDHSVSVIENRVSVDNGDGGAKKDTALLITSDGGDAKALLRLIEFVDRRINRIFVYRECISACAAMISFSNVPVRVSDGAIIGFHGDGETTLAQLERFSSQDRFECIYNDVLPFEKLRRAQGRDSRAVANETISRLGLGSPTEKTDFYERSGCKGVSFSSRKKMWFPTSKQLKAIFGIDLTGNLCNDSEKCVLDFAQRRWGNSTDIVIGDVVF